MNLVSMRERFAEHASDLAGDLSDGNVDSYLNRAYRYIIPSDVGGEFNESLWELTCVIGTDTYDYADNVIAPKGDGAWIDSYYNTAATPVEVDLSRTFLDIETNRSVFEYADRYENQNQGRPTSILFYGRQVLLTPVPDLAYVVQIPVRGGPSADLTTTGITNDIHALATVTAAAAEFLAESEDAEGVNRESALYNSYLKRLHVMAQARPNGRRWKRSF